MENKNVMKKVVVITISALLCVIPLLQSLQASTYASTITDKKVLSSNNRVQEKDLAVLDSEVFDSDIVKETVEFFYQLSNGNMDIGQIDKKKIVLNVSVDNNRAEVTVNHANDELVEFKILENGKKDLIAFNDKGEIFSEGEKVIIDEIIEDTSKNEVVANSQQRVESCPYGSASKYTYNANKTVTKSSNLPKKIVQYTVTGLSAIIASALTMGVGAGFVVAMATNLISDVAVNQMKTWKTVGKVYYHSSKKKFMVESSIGCQKEITTGYGKKSNGSWKKEYSKNIWLYLHTNGA